MYRPPNAQPCERLICLIYELLNADDDTARIAAGVAPYPIWQPHLAYFRDLQRLGPRSSPQPRASSKPIRLARASPRAASADSDEQHPPPRAHRASRSPVGF